MRANVRHPSNGKGTIRGVHKQRENGQAHLVYIVEYSSGESRKYSKSAFKEKFTVEGGDLEEWHHGATNSRHGVRRKALRESRAARLVSKAREARGEVSRGEASHEESPRRSARRSSWIGVKAAAALSVRRSVASPSPQSRNLAPQSRNLAPQSPRHRAHEPPSRVSQRRSLVASFAAVGRASLGVATVVRAVVGGEDDEDDELEMEGEEEGEEWGSAEGEPGGAPGRGLGLHRVETVDEMELEVEDSMPVGRGGADGTRAGGRRATLLRTPTARWIRQEMEAAGAA